jgi:hypothetical protein
MAFHALTEAFLAKHLGGECEPFTFADFPGNTLELRECDFELPKSQAR